MWKADWWGEKKNRKRGINKRRGKGESTNTRKPVCMCRVGMCVVYCVVRSSMTKFATGWRMLCAGDGTALCERDVERGDRDDERPRKRTGRRRRRQVPLVPPGCATLEMGCMYVGVFRNRV